MRFIKLTDIAREAGIKCETARSRIRKAYDDPTRKRLPVPVDHWLFKEKDTPRVLKIISQ